jgi:pSer/pThr/pTyr-binding forkhead associated (FHA) protein
MRRYRIGRGEGSEIVLSDKTVSRQHAELEELGAGRFRLRDLGSTRGTRMLRGDEWIEVRDAEIVHDTRIRLGDYETTAMELLRDLDKTVVHTRPAPPRPVDAPKPSPAVSAPAAAPLGSGSARPSALFWILLGGGVFAFLVIVAAVLALVLSGGGPDRADTGPPPSDEPRREANEGAQRFLETCVQRWRGPEQQCQCFVRAIGTVLDPADYDDMIEVVSAVIAKDNELVRRRMQDVTRRKGQAAQARLVKAGQAMDRDCPGR